MTQALNLALLGNNTNSSGQVSLTSGVSGTLPVANGGTGLTSPGSNGNVLTSNGSSWVSAAPTVTVSSVNGQTGAVTTTSIDSIGCTMFAIYAASGPGLDAYGTLSAGATLAGSALRYNFSATSYPAGLGQRYQSGGGYTTYSGGGSSLSGTWRVMSSAAYAYNDGGISCTWYQVLVTRVS